MARTYHSRLNRPARYCQNLSVIPIFIMPYLEEMGVRFGPLVRFWLWLGK
jgi:hypothetical protein